MALIPSTVRGSAPYCNCSASIEKGAGGFYGAKYSDFYTYHSYRMTVEGLLPHADGGKGHLCTETLCRPTLDIVGILEGLAKKKNGFIVWELMIGRDNCRYPWGYSNGFDEPTVPFQGVIYPDGHPWDVREVKVLLGEKAYAALEAKSIKAEYFTGRFAVLKKTSIVPAIDFDLDDEPGAGSPDASAGIGKENFSIRYTAKLVAPATGKFIFSSEADGAIRVAIDETQAIDEAGGEGIHCSDAVELVKGQAFTIQVDYVHRSGASHVHVSWEGPGFSKRIMSPE